VLLRKYSLTHSLGTKTIKPIWILLKQETVGGSGISWAICKSAPHYRQIPVPAPHHTIFLQTGCPSCHPTNSIKALKETTNRFCNKYTVIITCTVVMVVVIMAALCNRAGHYIFALWFLLLSCYLFSSPNLSRPRLDVCHTSTHNVALVQI